MSPQDMRETLISRTISVISNEGLDKTTTKAIVMGTGINEAYIYRNFSDKVDLLAKAFCKLDEELVDIAMSSISVMYMKEFDFETRCGLFFSAVWKFLLGNSEKSLAYIRYYYSQYFQKYSAEDHRRRYEPLVKKFEEAFSCEANIWMLLNYILVTMLDFAVRVFDGVMPNDDSTARYVFRLIYNSVKPYRKKTGESDS